SGPSRTAQSARMGNRRGPIGPRDPRRAFRPRLVGRVAGTCAPTSSIPLLREAFSSMNQLTAPPAAPSRRARLSLVAHAAAGSLLLGGLSAAQEARRPAPVFAAGQAQVADAFALDDEWIRHELWVETGFDSDGDGRKDRMHVAVTRQAQTDSEGLKVPVIYETSPYYSGVGTLDSDYFWNPRHELGEDPPPRQAMPDIRHRGRSVLSRSLVRTWVPRGFAVVH